MTHYIYKIKISFANSKKLKERAYDFNFNIRGKLTVLRNLTFFSVWLRTDTNAADIDRFRSHIGIFYDFYLELVELKGLCKVPISVESKALWWGLYYNDISSLR